MAYSTGLESSRQDDDVFKDPETVRKATISSLEMIVENSGGYKKLLITLKNENPCGY